MSKKPLIGITAAHLKDKEGETFLGANVHYTRAISDAGGIPVLIPETVTAQDFGVLLSSLQGILFSGGEDVDPSYYGESPHPKLGTIDRARDVLEIELARVAFNSPLPILGICRGQQVINVALGGSLIQDLPSQHPSDITHQGAPDSDDPVHSIRVHTNSVLHSLLGKTEVMTNSSHHQALKTIAPSLTPVAWSDDQVIEAVEAPSRKAFFLAVQSHPERIYATIGPSWRALFERFIKASASLRA